MRKKVIKNKKISDEQSAIVKPEISKIPFEDYHIEGEKHFKLRGECLDDVIFLCARMPMIWGIKMVQWGPMPDFELDFKTTITSDEILAILDEHEDAHIMIETLKPYDEYTGER